MEAALQALQHGNFGTGVLQETKLFNGIRMRYSAGYKVWLTNLESRHRVRIIIVCREEAGWQIEGVANYGPNLVIFTIMAWWKRCYVIRAYIPPNNQLTVHRVEQALL